MVLKIVDNIQHLIDLIRRISSDNLKWSKQLICDSFILLNLI